MVYPSPDVEEFEDRFAMVVFTEGQFETVQVPLDEANETYDPDHPQFGSGLPGVTGYGFAAGGGELADDVQVVGLVDSEGQGFRNVRFDLEAGTCAADPGAGGITDGEPFDWLTVLDEDDLPAVDGPAQVTANAGLDGLAVDPLAATPLVGLLAAAGLVVHRGRRG